MGGERIANAAHRRAAAPEDRPVAAELPEHERERIERPARVEAKQIRRRRGRTEAGDERRGIPPTFDECRPERSREPAGEIAAHRHRSEKVSAAHPALRLGERDQHRNDLGVRMAERVVVCVFEVEGVGKSAVHERSPGRRRSLPEPENGGDRRRPLASRERPERPALGSETARRHRHTDRIEE